MKLGLSGKTVVVTGGASGIGKAVAKAFGEEGARIALCDINEANLDATEAELKAAGVDVYTGRADVSDYNAVESFARSVSGYFGRIDIWINNAGIPSNKSILDTSPDEWDRVLRTNLDSVFYGIKCAAELMKDTGGGVILNTSSYTSILPASRRAAYAATKGGINAVTKVAAGELAPFGIRVNSIAPGTIETPMQSIRPPEEKKKAVEKIAMQRPCDPEELAKVYVFLASDAASYLTAVILEVSGGKLCIQDPEAPWKEAASGL